MTTPQPGLDGLRLRHWKTELRPDGVLALSFDREGESVNTFGQDVLIELGDLLDRVVLEPPKAMVLRSAKARGFIAGADIREFQEFDRKGTIGDSIRRGQTLFQRIADLPFPTVAAIHGFCMGGGTEISLACAGRVASNDPSTRIGLPEVKLGIYPGWGGSVRLPRLIGAPAAMDVMLTGRTLSASAARAMGVVDKVVAPEVLVDAAAELALKARASGEIARPFKQNFMAWITNTWPVRQILAPQIVKSVARKANKAHYPAPYALIETWRRSSGSTQQLLDAGEDQAARADTAASVAKGMVGLASVLSVQEGVQMHGGMGMTDAFDIGLYMKRQRVLAELFGDADYHAERLARLSGY